MHSRAKSVSIQSENVRAAKVRPLADWLRGTVGVERVSVQNDADTAGLVRDLACLHLADRLRTIESELASLKGRVDEKTRHLSLLLEQVIENQVVD